MTADTAMARRGFGEMAITGTIAGPLFNILCGLGAANLLSNIDPAVIGPAAAAKGIHPYVVFSLYDEVKQPDGTVKDELNRTAVIPLVLMIC